MNSNVYLNFLKFIIEAICLNFVLSVLANNVRITTPRNQIILVIIAILLTIILFYLQVVRHPNTPKNLIILAVIAFFLVISFGTLIWPSSPNDCTLLSSKSANYLSIGDTSLITKKTPNEKDREQQIYDNNKDLNENNSYLLAVAIPANAEPQAANAMLVGVADAQTKFNQHETSKTKPTISEKRLKIVVVDDQNNNDHFAK